ncbi:MAG: DUF4381 domain-containing protein [Planctomycetota bacterium]
MFGDNFGNPLLRDHFEEIIIPERVPFSPQTLGWAFLGVLLLSVLLWFVIDRCRTWKANRYRIVALKKLQTLQQALQIPEQKDSALILLGAFVKETALHAFGREKVASLTGDRWLSFLDQTYEGRGFSQGSGRLLMTLSYETPKHIQQVPESHIAEAIAVIQAWIRGHHVRV